MTVLPSIAVLKKGAAFRNVPTIPYIDTICVLMGQFQRIMTEIVLLNANI